MENSTDKKQSEIKVPITLQDGYVLVSGKYKGKTMEQVSVIDPQYLTWLVRTNKCKPIVQSANIELKKVLDKITLKSAMKTKLTFGMYRGMKLGTIVSNHRDYVTWLSRNTNCIVLRNKIKKVLQNSNKQQNKPKRVHSGWLKKHNY